MADDQTAESAFTNVDVMGNFTGMSPAEYSRLNAADARTARTDFANNDPRRLDRGDGGKEAMARTQEMLASAEEKRKEEQEAKTKVSVTPAVETGPVKQNVLRNYANYTYNLSLHIIPIEKYNNIIKGNVPYTNSDQTVLVASGGRRNSSFARNKNFKRDFYFENLKMTTVVGLNARSRNTNAIEINFTLIEPYGFTFINNLLKATAEIGAKNWFQVPFMLQIDFFGNTDEGEQVHPIPNTTKYIPVKLIGCKSKVSGRGAEYQIQAVPYTHTAFSESVVSTPAFFEVKAKTLKDFFSSSGSAGEATNITKFQSASKERSEQIGKEIDEEKKKNPNSPRIAELQKQQKQLSQDVVNTSFVVDSYLAAMNSYQKQLQENKHVQFSEEYQFVFTDPAMESSEIVVPKKTDVKRTPMTKVNSPGGIAAIRAQAGLPVAGVDLNTETFTINAGTSIIEVVNQAMRASEYIRKQFPLPAANIPSDGQAAADAAKKPIDWYKIVPVVEIKDFDEQLNRYSRKITYYISPYKYYNSKFRDAPKSAPDSYSKKYSYMYTGHNEDVIDFAIDFDTMFYTAITADKSKNEAVTTQKQPQEKPQDAGGDGTTHVKVQTPVTQPVSGQANMTNPASVDAKGILVNDFAKATMSGSRGDMINVKLKIIGDPDLIKQDDIFYNPANGGGSGNSIAFDASEVFALLEFKTPTDYDDTTGLMDFENVETSVFSGLYKMITVENEFSHGQFIQTLDLVRLFDQPKYDTVNGSEIQNTERKESAKTPAEKKAESEKADPGTPAEMPGYAYGA